MQKKRSQEQLANKIPSYFDEISSAIHRNCQRKLLTKGYNIIFSRAMCKNEKPNRIIEMQMFYGDIGRNINNYRHPQ